MFIQSILSKHPTLLNSTCVIKKAGFDVSIFNKFGKDRSVGKNPVSDQVIIFPQCSYFQHILSAFLCFQHYQNVFGNFGFLKKNKIYLLNMKSRSLLLQLCKYIVSQDTTQIVNHILENLYFWIFLCTLFYLISLEFRGHG